MHLYLQTNFKSSVFKNKNENVSHFCEESVFYYCFEFYILSFVSVKYFKNLHFFSHMFLILHYMYQLRFKAMLTTCVLQTYIKYFFSKPSSKTNIFLLVHKLVVCMILKADRTFFINLY